MTERAWFYSLAALLILFGGGYVAYTATRGIRNKNPGNIKKSGNALIYKGEILGTDTVFSTFDTMTNGLRAIGKILLTYQSKYGIDTVDGLIRRYSATDQEAYIQNVSDALGVEPDQSISVAGNLYGLIQGIVNQENGKLVAAAFISQDEIQTAVNEALSS